MASFSSTLVEAAMASGDIHFRTVPGEIAGHRGRSHLTRISQMTFTLQNLQTLRLCAFISEHKLSAVSILTMSHYRILQRFFVLK